MKIPLVITHSEDRDTAAGCNARRMEQLLGLPGIPAVAEAAAGTGYIAGHGRRGSSAPAHLSCAGSLELLRWSRDQGANVTAEVTPHHLLLTDTAVQEYVTAAKVNPPLRSEEDRQALCQALKEGLIDVIATDHAPHREEEKDNVFEDAPFGIVGLETAVPLLITELVHRDICLSELVTFPGARPPRD